MTPFTIRTAACRLVKMGVDIADSAQSTVTRPYILAVSSVTSVGEVSKVSYPCILFL